MGFRLVMLPPQTEITRGWAARLQADLPAAEIVIAESGDQASDTIATADAAFGTITPELLAKAANLRWIQAPAAAPPAGYYFPELIRHPVAVTNFRGIFNDHLATHIMAFVLAFARGLQLYLPQQQRRIWTPPEQEPRLVHLPEATMLIVGLGGIGGETARLAKGFGMTVIATDARRADRPAEVTELHPPEALDDLLPRADFVVLTVPHTPATEGFMGRERFRRMRNDAFFINIGRGRTTRLDNLVAALDAGEIAGAALDVFEQEPLPADHPLWTMPNVMLTPHMAGNGPYLDERRYAILLANCRAMIEGSELVNVVDKAMWF